MGTDAPFLHRTAVATAVVMLALAGRVPGGALQFRQGLAGRINPAGLLAETDLAYRIPATWGTGPLHEGTHVEFGLRNEWTPSDDWLAVFAAFEPLAVLNVKWLVGPYFMYDELGQGRYVVPAARSAYDGESLDTYTREDEGGWWTALQLTLKMKAGPLIAANVVQADYISLRGQGFFLDQRLYAVRGTQDLSVHNEVYLFYEFADASMAGANYGALYVAGTSYSAHRIAAVAAVTPVRRGPAEVRCVVIAGTHLRARYVKGRLYGVLKVSLALARTVGAAESEGEHEKQNR
jgi:hypothetical protein